MFLALASIRLSELRGCREGCAHHFTTHCGGHSPSMKNELSRVGCRKLDSPGWWRFSSPSASVGASPRPAVLCAVLVDDSLSLRWREVPCASVVHRVGPTRREDAQPSIQDRAATCGGARGKHVLRNRIQRDAAIHPDESRWIKGPSAPGWGRGRPESSCPSFRLTIS